MDRSDSSRTPRSRTVVEGRIRVPQTLSSEVSRCIHRLRVANHMKSVHPPSLLPHLQPLHPLQPSSSLHPLHPLPPLPPRHPSSFLAPPLPPPPHPPLHPSSTSLTSFFSAPSPSSSSS